MGSSSRFFTKPVITVNLDCAGSIVVLGRSESTPYGNSVESSDCDKLVSAIEKKHPSIQVLVSIRRNAQLIYMSRAAEKLTGLNKEKMTDSIIDIMGKLQ